MAIYFSNEPSKISVNELPSFPRSRYDNNKFIWEEALVGGNYCTVHVSAQGSTSSRERIIKFLNTFHADKSHFGSFEIRVDGIILKDAFVFENQDIVQSVEGFEKHIVTLFYPPKDIRVKVITQLDGSDFMLRWLEIENIGSSEVVVTGLFPLAGILYPEVKGNAFKAEHLRPQPQIGLFKDNYYLGEGEFQWQKMPKATLKFGHERALFNPPMFALIDGTGGGMTLIHIETGLMTQAEFTKCGDYYYSRHVSNDDYVHFKVGQDERSTHYKVEPGCSIVSPKIHISQIYTDLDGCTNAFNRHLRRSVIPHRNQKIYLPVEYNHSSYSENCQITKQFLLNEVEVAEKAGAELFVIDAGWFGSAERSWSSNRGDWFENELLADELKDVFDFARSKGMMCGMWMEAEGMDFGTKLSEQHPDWFAKAYSRNLPTINLLIPQAREYVYSSISGMIRKYGLDLFRIDGGLKEPLDTQQSHGSSGGYADYYETLYGIFNQLRSEFPDLYFENCSGGGGRSDLAIMRNFDWMQATDNFEPSAQLRTIYGLSLAFPIEQLLSITGVFMEHQTDADFMARSCIFGRPAISGIADGADRINPLFLSSWTRAMTLYKNVIRPILPECNIYHHTPLENYMEHGKYLVLEIASKEKNVSVTGIFRLEGADTDQYLFFPKGISMSETYDIYFDNTKESIRLNGYCLQNQGIRITLPGKVTSEIVVMKQI